MDAHDLINGTALARCAARYASAAAHPHSNTSSTTTVERTVEGGLLLASKAGLNLDSASAVVALVERQGRVRAIHVPIVNQGTLKPILTEQIATSARLMTDSAGLYKNITEAFKSHEVVDHSAGEYVRGDVTTNTVEGYFGILKRGIGGIYQHVSKEHLNRYVSEFSFRYNNRIALKIDDRQRTINALAGIEGKRLTA